MLSALRWVLKSPDVDTTIPSMTDADQLKRPVKAMTGGFSTQQNVLARQLEFIAPLYCRMCGACAGACAKGLPVADTTVSIIYVPIKSADSRLAANGFAGIDETGKRKIDPAKRGRFLDLRTLGWALRNISYSLKSAAKEFGSGIEKLEDHEPTGTISPEEIEYCRQDVRATVAVLNGMKAEFDLHPIEWLKPDRVFSPASIAKAYIKEMGISNLLDKKPPKNSAAVSIGGYRTLGKAMQSYFGGRAEVRIRHTPVPIVYCDVLSEYPTVNTLMHLWNILTAETIEIVDCTGEVKKSNIEGLSRSGV